MSDAQLNDIVDDARVAEPCPAPVCVEAVPDPWSGRVFNTRNKIFYTLVVVGWCVALFAGTAAIVGTLMLLSAGGGLQGVAAGNPQAVGAIGLAVLGVILLLPAGWVCGYDQTYFLRRGYARRLREQLIHRPDPLVDADDPLAFFVKLSSRKNWHKIKLDDADDVGFLLIDQPNQLLAFEGDHQRIVIPADAIEFVGVEFGGSGQEPFYLVIIHIKTQDGMPPPKQRELCFEYDQLRGRWSSNTSKKHAMALCARIASLLHVPCANA